MKTRIIQSALLFAFLGTALTACVNGDDYNTPNLECSETSLVKTKEVSEIPAAATVAQYLGDDVIEAYVTSSDEGGNFYKSISFQTLDGSKAFSVPVDVTSTFINFSPGRKVMIKMKDLYTDIRDGGMRIGGVYVSNGSAQVGRMTAGQYASALNRSCTVVSEEDLVQHVTIAEAKTDAMINKLIEIDAVQFSNAAITTTYYNAAQDLGGATNHLLEDAGGNTVIFRTSSFANYAYKPVAPGRGSVRGVMTKFGSDYQFVARTENDIKLDGERINAFYVEDFQAAIDNTNLNLPGWTNFAESGTKLWREEVFSGNGYAEFSSFGSGNALNVAWLVSPAINLDATTNEFMTFRTAQHHLDVDSPDNSLTVYVSTNFDGTNVLAATWTPVTVTLPTQSTAWYAFVSSGVVDLSSYSGNIHVAFKFKGSGTNTTLDGAFQVDDLKVFGN